MTTPKTSQLTLSVERVEKFRKEAERGFQRNSISRELVRTSDPSSMEGFVRIGVHHIVDRIWFVDSADMGFGPLGGYEYGAAIAEEEALQVLGELLRGATSDHITEVTGDPKENDVENLLLEVQKRGLKPSLILTNVAQSFNFWDFKQFAPKQDELPLGSLEGYFRGIPIYYSRLLPSGLTLTVDNQKTGTLEVKTSLTISISDIKQLSEREEITQQLPRLAGEDINEKVSVLCYEIIKVNLSMLKNTHPLQILRTRGTELKVAMP